MNFNDFNSVATFKMNNEEHINFSIANSKMTEEEWTNFNNYMKNYKYGEGYDEKLLINTFIDFVIVTTSYHGIETDGKPDFTMHLHNFSENLLLIHSGDLASEKCRLPETITELVEWTEDIYREMMELDATAPIPVFDIYLNQNNDKFMCLVRLWDLFHKTYMA